MALEGKFSVKHFLNLNLVSRKGKYPLYLTIGFQNKNAKLRSRLRYFDMPGFNGPLDVVSNYASESEYFSKKELGSIEGLIKRETEAMALVGDYFKSINVNVIDHEPSRVYDISISSLKNLVSGVFWRNLVETLVILNYKSLAEYLATYSTGTNFTLLIKVLKEVGNNDLVDDVIPAFENQFKVMTILGRGHRIIEWLAKDDLRHQILQRIEDECGASFSQNISHLIHHSIQELVSPYKITIPKPQSSQVTTARVAQKARGK